MLHLCCARGLRASELVGLPLAAIVLAMEAAHAELRTRCPKCEVARMDLSVDDDD